MTAKLAATDNLAVLASTTLRRVDLVGVTDIQLAQLATDAPQLEVAVLRKPRVRDLRAVGRLRGLRALRLQDATAVESLSGLDRLSGLHTLSLENLPKVSSLAPLRSASTLVEMSMTTLFSRTSPQLIDSLTGLAHLRVIRFEGVVARDRDLRPLWHLRDLQELCLPNHYPLDQLGQLTGALPGITGWGVTPYDSLQGVTTCKKCGKRRRVQLFGRTRGRFVCLTCDGNDAMQHRHEFERWRRVGENEAREAGLL